jgi:N-carbamoyl-L-amino-acid hydrolase
MKFDANTPSINGDRCWQRLMELADITDRAEPWTRRSFSPLFLEGRRWLRRAFEEAGLAVRTDAGGNLLGRLPGSAGCPQCILVGSHSDTVPGGGRFDGIAGVLAGLEIAATLRERGERLRHDLEIADFLAEEPSEYGVSCIGSRAIAGELTPAMLQATNAEGETLAAALRRAGGEPQKLQEAIRHDLAACFELHIEQGAVLESRGIALGIASAIVGITRLSVTFTGEAAHAGTTPMPLRHDALLAASDFILHLHAQAAELAARGPGYFVATTGKLTIRPNAANVVPGEVSLFLDLRSEAHALVEEFLPCVQSAAAAAAARHGVRLSRFERASDSEPAACDLPLMEILRQSSDALGYTHMDLVSGAGHDSAFLSRVAPAAMLFVPSRGGRSHCPEEWTEPAQLTAGVATLFAAVRRFDAARP